MTPQIKRARDFSTTLFNYNVPKNALYFKVKKGSFVVLFNYVKCAKSATYPIRIVTPERNFVRITTSGDVWANALRRFVLSLGVYPYVIEHYRNERDTGAPKDRRPSPILQRPTPAQLAHALGGYYTDKNGNEREYFGTTYHCEERFVTDRCIVGGRLLTNEGYNGYVLHCETPDYRK